MILIFFLNSPSFILLLIPPIISLLMHLHLFFLSLPFIQQNPDSRTSTHLTTFGGFWKIRSTNLPILFLLHLLILSNYYLSCGVYYLSFFGSFRSKNFEFPLWKRRNDQICWKGLSFYTHTTFSLLQPNHYFVDSLLDNILEYLTIICVMSIRIMVLIIPFLLKFFSRRDSIISYQLKSALSPTNSQRFCRPW